jgi:alcohol dehydrogenase class IV
VSALSFVYDGLPGRVVFGVGSIDRVEGEVTRLGIERVMVITDAEAKAIAEGVMEALGSRLASVITGVRQHVPEDLAAAAREQAAASVADGIVTIGGGSATGLAKAVAVGVDGGLPILAVPTTYAGSEMTPIYGITGRHKQTGRDLRALPRTVVYDPALTVGLPPEVTGPSGLNAVAHCVEALYGPGANPITGLLAEEGVRVLGRSLPVAVERPDDLDARTGALYGACLAGTALAVAGTALHHKLCHVLGGTYGLVHGEVNAVVLPHAVAYNAIAVPDEMARVASALGGPRDAEAAAGLLFDLAVATGAPTSLEAIGMPASGLDEAAARAAGEIGDGNPRPVDATGLRALLAAAFEGRRP